MIRLARAGATQLLQRHPTRCPASPVGSAVAALARPLQRAGCLLSSTSSAATLPTPPPILKDNTTDAAAAANPSHSSHSHHSRRHYPHKSTAASATNPRDFDDDDDTTNGGATQQEIEACPLPANRFESSLCEFQYAYSAFKDGRDISPRVTGFNLCGGSSQDIFANADLPLSRISAFGFDFDYTLASYNDQVSFTIYELARDYLVETMGYPTALRARSFDASFAIRGLHFDTRTGFVLKIDQFAKVQTGCVYLGRRQVTIAEIIEAYRGVSLTKDYVDKYLHQLVDLFALSETTLLSDCIQTFIDGGLTYSPDYIQKDVRRAVEFVHSSGVFHRRIMAAPEQFLAPSPRVGDFLLRLRDARRFTFMLTNSPYAFVDRGMRFMLRGIESHPSAAKYGVRSSRDWTKLFDVTITSARKPTWFVRDGRFRRVETGAVTASADADAELPETAGLGGKLSWSAVDRFERGAVYTEGSLAEFTRLVSLARQQAAHAAATEASLGAPPSPVAAESSTVAASPSLRGHEVLYFGDHVGADLTAPWLRARWRTVAIVRELEHEVAVQSSAKFKQALRKLLQVEALIDYGQRITDPETRARLQELKRLRQTAKQDLLGLFNPHFGSVFRTSTHRTEFFGEVGRFSDCYTSNVTNFLHYSLHHTFYAKRIFFPHEINYALKNMKLTAETAAKDGDTYVDDTHTVPLAP